MLWRNFRKCFCLFYLSINEWPLQDTFSPNYIGCSLTHLFPLHSNSGQRDSHSLSRSIASQRHDYASFPAFYQLNAWLLIAANITSASITFLSIWLPMSLHLSLRYQSNVDFPDYSYVQTWLLLYLWCLNCLRHSGSKTYGILVISCSVSQILNMK